jgi:two-component system sensor histidine kinase KdpD
VRYSPGDAPITVTAHRGEHEIDLRVIDRGPGVPADEHVAIFDEFYRSGARTEEEGTGLGLAIVRAMVAAQDGRVWCEDTPGGGATFVVRFPLGAPPDDEPGSESAGAPPRVGPDTTAHREGTS